MHGMVAMLRGKHVYCRKPLTRTVWEASELTKAAAKNRLATQLGPPPYRRPSIGIYGWALPPIGPLVRLMCRPLGGASRTLVAERSGTWHATYGHAEYGAPPYGTG